MVEDDLTNRQYLAELLQRQGVTCDVAINGREAVAYYQKRLTGPGPAYQLVLMDYHLPEMDGWTATRAIRQAEAAHSAAPATVLGVTAASGTDDRAAGDQAGIDGWLDKPINPDALRQALATHAPPPSTAEPPLDAAAALERCMGDTHFFGATLDNFTQTLPELLDAFETALTQGDRAGAGAHAHAIKGAAGLITAFTLRDAAARCEQIGLDTSAGNLSELQQQADALRIEVQRCLQYATQIRDDVGA